MQHNEFREFWKSLREQAAGNVYKKNSVTGRRLNEEGAAPADQGPMLAGNERPGYVSGVIGRLAYQLIDAIKGERSIPTHERETYLNFLKQLVQRVYHSQAQPGLGQAGPSIPSSLDLGVMVGSKPTGPMRQPRRSA